jgi:ABC-type transporter Mla subunit MlaD
VLALGPNMDRGMVQDGRQQRETTEGAVKGEKRPPAGVATSPSAASANDGAGDYKASANPEAVVPGAQAKTRRPGSRRPAGPARSTIAANDDAPTIGGLIYALNQQPSQQPFIVAAAASGLWFALAGLFGWALLLPEISRMETFAEIFARPAIITIAATVVIPIALFWFLAMLVWRAQELRLMSQAMTEVAVRLAEPDRMAEQSVASLGQAVRRQVSFMTEAVSRALGRAGELEALVHNEVGALERSYSENEHKIRGLIQELAGERHALVGTSDQVSETLRSLGHEVPALIEKLSHQQVKLAKIIEGAGQNLIALETQISTASGNLETTLSNRTQYLQTVLDDYTRALDATLASRAEALDAQLVERTRALDSAFSERVRLFDESILRSTMAIDTTVSEKARALSSAMETQGKVLAETLGRQAHEMDETLMHGINAVRRTSENITRQSVKAIEGLSNQADLLKNVSENLLQQISNVTSRFDGQGQSIMRAANALETANFRIDATLQKRHGELTETLSRLSGKAEQLDGVLHGYSSTLEGSISNTEARAKALTAEMSRGAEMQAKAALSELERLRAETESHTTRALEDLRGKFSNVSREVSEHLGNLSSRFNETSEELRSKAQRAAAEFEAEQASLRAQADRLPSATRESAEAMRHVLQEQLRALEQLSSLTTRETTRREVVPPSEPGSPLPLTAAYLAQQAQQPYQQRPALPAVPAPAAAPGVEQAARDRWTLGDLLARASQAEDGGARSVAVNINSIVRALDPATASAIWLRLRAGQRGIMVRSIYSTDGRSAFDEAARRYQGDAEFRATVDRYMGDFERLLRDTEQKDPSGRVTHSHLISDSGRVYLFLAHASGRLT